MMTLRAVLLLLALLCTTTAHAANYPCSGRKSYLRK